MWEIWANYVLPKALKKLPKVQKIAQSGHTVHHLGTFCHPLYPHRTYTLSYLSLSLPFLKGLKL